MSKKRRKKKSYGWAIYLLIVAILIAGVWHSSDSTDNSDYDASLQSAYESVSRVLFEENSTIFESDSTADTIGNTYSESISLSEIPAYSGRPYIAINDNQPDFDFDNLSATAYESYADLDRLGRCGVAEAILGKETMPADDEERGTISGVYPSGWEQENYDCVDGGYLYNRCHLIGWQLSCENANEKNLITGTRYMNTEGMLPFENMVADYIRETGNHIAYRVTPVYDGNNLVASGVQVEAYSIEDNGDGICFNIYCYNVQPSIVIDYATGESRLV